MFCDHEINLKYKNGRKVIAKSVMVVILDRIKMSKLQKWLSFSTHNKFHVINSAGVNFPQILVENAIKKVERSEEYILPP